MTEVMAAPQQLVAVDPRTDARWQALSATGDGSLFISPPWLRSVCDTYGFTPQARVTMDADGQPNGGFAWVPISDIRGDRMVSLPFSDRAEPIVPNETAWPVMARDALTSEAPLTIRCLDGTAPTTDTRLVRTAEAAWQGTPLDLPLTQLYESLHPSTRRNIVAAERNGVKVQAFTGLAAVRVFHGLHVSLRKHKYRMLAQPLAFFERIWEEFSAIDGIVTVLAYYDDEPIAGALYLAWGDTLYYKFSASLAGTLSLRPNEVLLWSALQWAVEHQFRWLDWGLSDLDQPGLIAYKRKWASLERRIVTLRSEDRTAAPSGDPGQLLSQVTSLLTDDAVPDEITRRAGALLYRYFA
jgi:CelD/BcsL family acetyltransferase involved in cellulose biosynthesis